MCFFIILFFVQFFSGIKKSILSETQKTRRLFYEEKYIYLPFSQREKKHQHKNIKFKNFLFEANKFSHSFVFQFFYLRFLEVKKIFRTLQLFHGTTATTTTPFSSDDDHEEDDGMVRKKCYGK